MFKLRSDSLGWHQSQIVTNEKEVQAVCETTPLTIVFSEGVHIQTCPHNPGPVVNVQLLENMAHKLLLTSSMMDI